MSSETPQTYKSCRTKHWLRPSRNFTLRNKDSNSIPIYLNTSQPHLTMSFSNTSVGDKPADPYKKLNQDDPPLETKVNDLVDFIKACKFGMMTTHEAATSNLVSRCMALASTVSYSSAVICQ